MTEIFGRTLEEVLARVGTLDQVARIDSLEEVEGVARGTRRLRLVTGGGLEVEIHPDRALDLGVAAFDGMPLSWLSSTGFAAPGLSEPEGTGWLQTFGGGLLTTCGLESFGPPADDEDGRAGMHGAIGRQPARVTRVEVADGTLTVSGTTRQTRVFGENLRLDRTITAAVGGTSLRIDDVVTNEAAVSSPHMILYHVNLGWPLLEEGVRLEIPASSVRARDEDAEAGLAEHLRIEAPRSGYREQVFIHDTGERAQARLVNDRVGVALALRWSGDTLPVMFQWKKTDVGHYVLGLEPANTPEILGRAAARAAGRLVRLAPGERAAYRVEFALERL